MTPNKSHKATKKSGAKSGVLVAQPHGGALKQGGDHPRPGRPRLEYVEWCRDLLDQADSRAQVEAVMRDSRHPAYHQMYKELAARAHGKPRESVDVTHSGEVTVKQEWTFGAKRVAF